MHDGRSEWATPKPVPFTIPAAAHYVGPDLGAPPTADFIADATDAYSELGDVVHFTQYGAAHTFYSAHFEEGVRGGVVIQGTKANFAAACDEDTVVHFVGHADAQGFDLSPTESFEVADIVPGAYTQAKLVHLPDCYTLAGPDAIGRKFVKTGLAQSAVGYTGEVEDPWATLLDTKFWELLSKGNYSVAGAASAALEWFIANTPPGTAHDHKVDTISVEPPGSGVKIGPAF
jgi:hypothetical protein